MTAFKAKREDGRAQWRVVYDELHNDPPDSIYGYSELGKLLGTRDRNEIYRAVARCNRELWKKDQRSLTVRRGIGYRMLKPQEHEFQALEYQESGRRKIRNAVSVIRAVDLEAISDAERTRALNIETCLVAMGRAIDHHTKRLTLHDDILRDLAERVDGLEQQRDRK